MIMIDISNNSNNTRLNKRCPNCRKKLGLTAFTCRCGFRFCPHHRYPENHNCPYDYKKQSLDILQKNLPSCVGNKIEKL